MSITSLVFVLFVFATLILYYIVPKKFQWVILLLSSLVFYITSSTWGIIYVLITAASIYFGAVGIENNRKKQKAYIKANKDTLTKEAKSAYKKKNQSKRKWMMIGTVLINAGVLCVLKYCHFAVDILNLILPKIGAGALNNEFSWLIPLGLSFYTFQSIGYIVDVYWEKIEAQRNPLKMLLFVSFFPQVTQGPISEYKQLSEQLFKEHSLTYENFSCGFQRAIWGFFKKMVIANTLAPLVSDIFTNFREYLGITCFIGILAYSIQIYADFSGYMDIMCGLCEMFDIRLSENFIRPYFSKSIAEYWRRWHITLGVWFKNYIYYPIGVSKLAQNLGKKLKKPFGQKVAQNIPATLALLLVWFTTGLWHGASLAYIIWGLVNGVIIIFSMWMEPVYEKTKSFLHISSRSKLWNLFQVARTFLLVSFIKMLPETKSLNNSLKIWKRCLTNFDIPKSINDVLPTFDKSQLFSILTLFIGIGLMMLFSIIQRKHSIRCFLLSIPLPLRSALLAISVFIVFSIGLSNEVIGGFMYAMF